MTATPPTSGYPVEGWASAKALSFWGLTGKAIEDGDLINWQNGALWTRLSPTDSRLATAATPAAQQPAPAATAAAVEEPPSWMANPASDEEPPAGLAAAEADDSAEAPMWAVEAEAEAAAAVAEGGDALGGLEVGPAELSDGEATSLAGAPAHEQLGQMLGVSMTTLAVWVWGVIGLLLVLGGVVALSLRRELGAGGGGGLRRPSRVLSPFGAHRGMSRLSTKDDDEDDGSPPRNGPGWDESPRRSEVSDNYTL